MGRENSARSSNDMATITSALLLCLLAIPPSSPPLLRVDMEFKGLPMRPRLEAAAMEEATNIWAAYGVDVQKLNPSDAARDDAVRLSVVLADHADRRMTAAGALGSILFLDDSPEPTIVMYSNAIAALMSDVRMSEHPSSEWPLALQDAMHGRVLGRALAHEIGHYLLRSRQHSEVGLMRARQSVFDLVAAGRQSFFLSADETARLWSVTSSSSASCSPGSPQ
jgi:hypothetical protein